MLCLRCLCLLSCFIVLSSTGASAIMLTRILLLLSSCLFVRYWLCCAHVPASVCHMRVTVQAPKIRGERRAAERAEREASERRVRQRLEEVEIRLDGDESLSRSHDQRISFQESPQRLVLRSFACVGEFFGSWG